MKQLHTTTFPSRVFRSLLALSTCALVAAGCGPGSMSQTQTLAVPQALPAWRSWIKSTELTALSLPGPTDFFSYGRLPPRPRRPSGDHTLQTSQSQRQGYATKGRGAGEPGGHDPRWPLLMDVRAEGLTVTALEQAFAGAVR